MLSRRDFLKSMGAAAALGTVPGFANAAGNGARGHVVVIGDEVLIEGTGPYTPTYSAVAFNGFEPLKAYVI